MSDRAGLAGPEAGLPQPDEKRDRPRRVNSLLSAYYSIEGNVQRSASAPAVDLDQHGFDAKRYFDGVVSAGHLPDLVQRSTALDDEVRGLDNDMQKLVYENYTQFTRAAGVISRMKVCIESLGSDIARLEDNLGTMSQLEDRAEAAVSERSGQLAVALKRQQACKKLEVLFGLPSMLDTCLDRRLYVLAVEAYTCCSAFLRQHNKVPAFQHVHDEVERRMVDVTAGLEEQLRSMEVPAQDAAKSGELLLELGGDAAAVVRGFLDGRAAALEHCLDRCFAAPGAEAGEQAGEAHAVPEAPGGAARGAALEAACQALFGLHAPQLCAAAAGARRLLGASTPGADAVLLDFVRARLGETSARLAECVRRDCPPTQLLVACIDRTSAALEPLQPQLSGALTELLARQHCELVRSAVETVFAAAAFATVADLLRLHGECDRSRREGPAGESGSADEVEDPSDVLEATAGAERALILHGYNAVAECRHLLAVLRSAADGAPQLVRQLQVKLSEFFWSFVALCHAFAGHDPTEVLEEAWPARPSSARPPHAELDQFGALGWNGLFGLILVRMGRHLEVKVISKVWSVARDMFSESAASVELTPHPSLIRATRGAAQALITHYTLVAGHRLGHFFLSCLHAGDWSVRCEPRDPRFLAQVVRDMRTWDAELALILGDPRKERTIERRPLGHHTKDSMELEMERLWAKKLQAFSPSPFNRNGVVVGILRIGFKALYEYVRDMTFTKYELHQIQLDCACLSAFAQDFTEVEDASMLGALLNEAVTSAAQRCDDPMLMDAAILESLCEDKKRQFTVAC